MPASPPPEPAAHPPPQHARMPKDSIVARLFITPVSFISFLISLALIDQRNSSLRAHHHESGAHESSSQTLLGRLRDFMRHCIWEPQPYAYVQPPDVRTHEKRPAGERTVTGTKEEPWHWHTKQRKMMRMEIADAFQMRKWVVVAMVALLAASGAMGVWALHFACRLVGARF